MYEKFYPLDYRPSRERGHYYLLYADVYKNTVEILLDNLLAQKGYEFQVLKERLNDSHGFDHETLPLLFNFRHYVELQLTGLILYGSIISPELNDGLNKFLEHARKNHSMTNLFNKFRQFKIHIGSWDKNLICFILTPDKFDLKSDRFRYPENRKGVQFFTSEDTKYIEHKYFYLNLKRASYLHENIIKVIDTLESLETYFDLAIEDYYESLEYRDE